MTKKPNRLVIILILGSLSTISPFAIDMYLPAFPQIAADLHVSAAKISFSISSYFAGLAIGQCFYGPLLDRFGRKRPLYAGLGIFLGASLLCLRSRTVEWLVIMRFVQALGGCGAQVASLAMVRDFFPVKDTAKIISLLILILSVSPLLAPTIGGFISIHLGWQWVFVVLAAVAAANVALVMFCLPEGHAPDRSVSMRLGPIFGNFAEVLREKQFLTYALSGAFAFAGLLVYVAGSPIIFMQVFRVSPKTFSAIFAALSVGFIGSNQVNSLLLRRFSSEQIFKGALWVECATGSIFLLGTYCGWFGLWPTLVLLFITLSSLGLAYPNAAALALAPFSRNIGSASALLGFLQIGVSGIASASIGFLDSHRMLPVVIILAVTAWIGLAILTAGRRQIPQLRFIEEADASLP